MMAGISASDPQVFGPVSLTLPEVKRLAHELAFILKPGDLITLRGDLGAGKTTVARAMIVALTGTPDAEIPSPTFSLVQPYETRRMPVAHFDLYRLTRAEDLGELGLDAALEAGVALVEWPERAEGGLPPDRLEIALSDLAGANLTGADFAGADLAREEETSATTDETPEVREVMLIGMGSWAPRLERLLALRALLDATPPWNHDDHVLDYLQGDASARRYARLRHNGGGGAVVMDWPRQPDGPPIRDNKPYSRIAHLAEGVRPFVAIAGVLQAAGFACPTIRAHDMNTGFLILDDLGDDTFGAVMARAPSEQPALWQAAMEVLVALRRVPVPARLPLPDGTSHVLPTYDAEAMGIEVELLLDWYWPLFFGRKVLDQPRREFLDLWGAVFDRLGRMPQGWVLRDFHSPNLMWLPDNMGVRRVGLLDFQDALCGSPAYDLVSLLQDARLDVPSALEDRLFNQYCAAVKAFEPDFQREPFAFAYAALGAQRNTKILGIFARLAERDGKRSYLAHIPRIWRYLDRCLRHPDLAELSAWYVRHFPPARRNRTF